MKSEDVIRAQRDYFWASAQKAEDEGEQFAADAFAILVGTLDWALDELHPDLLDAEVTDED